MHTYIPGTARARRVLGAQGNFFFMGALAITVTLAVLSANPAAAGSFAPALSQPQYETTYTNKPVKSRLGQLTQTDPSLLGRTDSTPINVMVKLDYDALASYEGNIPGYAATSPKKTGKKLKQNQTAVNAYVGYIVGYESKVLDAVKGRVPEAKIGRSFRSVYGGIAMTLPANKIGDLLSVNGVVAVQEDALEQPLTDVTPAFLGADQVWPSLGGSTKAGEGVIVGVLDTGIWPEHPSFVDHGLAPPPGGPFACQFGVGGDAPFSCNNKLVGAYAFLNTYTTFIGALPGENCIGSTCSARDAGGHGTHTSSTAAGGPVDHATLLGVDRGHISGMAPGAHVIMYRVCLDQGCFQSDSVAAVDQAINDGVDIINFSISGGASAYTDPVEGAFFDAYAAGTLVNASAGNSGPSSGTSDHAGPWTNTVGASTSNRHFFSTLHLTSTNGPTLDVPGVTVTAGTLTPTDVVLANATATDPNRLCLEPAPAGTYTGKVVICRRGTNARIDKGYNVLQGGAAGMILYNTANQDLESDNHWLSAIHINGPSTGTTGNSAKVLAFLAANTGVKATWVGGTATPVRGDVMAAFSSRGPVGDFIKPDVTAPGVQILAGMTPQYHPTTSSGAPFVTPGPQGQLYQAIAGTSMSSPHSAGVAALIKALHPDWTPGQIKSALMTSSVQDTLKEDGVTPATPFDRGAGAIRANRAASPTVTFDVDPTDYLASASDPLGRINLNLPSVNALTLPGQITTFRTMRNVTSVDHSLEVSVQAPPGVQIIVAATPKGSKPASVSDKSMAVIAGQETTFQVTIKAPTVADGQYFGQITLDPKKKGYNSVVIPVAFNKRQGQVTLTHDCTPTTFATTSHTDCTVRAENFVGTDASVNIEVDASAGLEYSNVSAPATQANKSTIVWSGTLVATTPPDISIGPGPSPFGYLPLSAFGIPPIAGVGDDTLTNFDVPAFLYGGEVYTRVGVASNGYLVIGGGSGADNTINNQNLPDPTRPNNVIAAFWTDLNPAAAGAIRIATLTDGSDTWIVVDWQGVREFSTAGNLHSFEIWIGINGDTHPAEDVSIAYGPNTGSGDNGRLTVGAENKVGNRGGNIYFNGTGTLPVNGTQLRVTSSPPVAGGNVTFTYDASAKKAGSYSTTANLTSNLTPGTTQDVVPLTVTP
jgi:subtilisin family serine protease